MKFLFLRNIGKHVNCNTKNVKNSLKNLLIEYFFNLHRQPNSILNFPILPNSLLKPFSGIRFLKEFGNIDKEVYL